MKRVLVPCPRGVNLIDSGSNEVIRPWAPTVWDEIVKGKTGETFVRMRLAGNQIALGERQRAEK